MVYSVFFPIVEICQLFLLDYLYGGGIEAATTTNVTLGELIAFILYIHCF